MDDEEIKEVIKGFYDGHFITGLKEFALGGACKCGAEFRTWSEAELHLDIELFKLAWQMGDDHGFMEARS